MRARELPTDSPFLVVRPWADPVIDQVGHDPRSTYVERFWLGIIGPSAAWLLRHLVDRLEADPDGFDLELAACATAIGLGHRRGPNAAFPRTIARCCQFGAARLHGPVTLEVRRKLPPLTLRQVSRLPDDLRADHRRWVDRPPAAVAADALRDRARRLALSLLELGEDRDGTERQLHRWRFHPAMASEATAWAVDRHAGRTGGTAPAAASVPPGGGDHRTEGVPAVRPSPPAPFGEQAATG